jgi:hypothetical protein
MEDIHSLIDRIETRQEVTQKGNEFFWSIGAKVKVKDRGHTYSTYEKLAEYLKATHWDKNHLPENGMVVKIIARAYHGEPQGQPNVNKDTKVYLVQNMQGSQYLIGEGGLSVKT